MKIVCIGGGPAGLYAALLLKKHDPAREITVVERNRPYDTFGWGVVFSDQTLANLVAADEPSARAILGAFNHWDDIDVLFKGARVTSGGHGFCGIGRRHLLNILQQRCEELGVRLVFESDVQDDQAVAARYGADLVIASDGLNSRIRQRYAATYAPQIESRRCRFVWLGTRQKFKAFTFAFKQTEHGWFQAHIYQYDAETSTFIIETPEDVWRRAGLDRMSQEEGIAWCERLFAEELGGERLLSNAAHLRGSAMWISFSRVACARWVHWHGAVPVVLIGDAAHSAHYSIGSGTKLALEDAIELARACAGQGDLAAALHDYEQARALEVLKIQSAARNSMEWFENVARYSALEAPQFAYAMLTRSQRLSHENLRLRDPAYVARFEDWFARRACSQAGVALPDGARVPPMLTPLRVRGLTLKNRIVVSPMAQYCATDGVVGDYHLVHLGARALGGAALVFAEMTCVSADARITPACPGLYAEVHTLAWKRIVDFIHVSGALAGIQLGHAGPKGSTRPMWEGIDQPLPSGNWPLVAASEQQYLEGVSQMARAATPDDMARIEADFAAAARRASEAGFDWLELHCAHGYLLSSFISPLTNRRTDEYGGSLENRCRFPLRVFRAVRAAWPVDRPVSVRISAHDWVEGGITPDDAVAIARLFKEAGADMIDCSSGQVSKREQPVYGRMFQTPFADLCAVGRPHLANPAWTLHEAARIGFGAIEWPRSYRAGKAQLERNLARGA